MEELELGEDMLLKSLQNSGIRLPGGGDGECYSIKTLITQTPGALLSICSQSLRRIDSSLLPPLPVDDHQTTAERVDISSQMSAAIQKLGHQISFHQLLYPSEDDSYNLLRFLVERLSHTSSTLTHPLSDDWPAKPQTLNHKTTNYIKSLQSQGEMILGQELTTDALDSLHLDTKIELLDEAMKLTLDDQHPVDFYIEELNRQVEAKRQNLQELKSHWNASIKPLEEEKRSLEEALHAQRPDMQLDFQKVKEVKLQTEAIILKIGRREEERLQLSDELVKRPKAASRKSYIERISEITKNSRKQDADIEGILKDTRELQIESNSIQERLHRTYVVADETMFRDVKKDPMRQPVYRLLTSIHENFGKISEEILATDRIKRQVVEQEAKLAAISTRNLNMEKLQADLDAIRKENEMLEKQLRHQAASPKLNPADDV